MNILESTFGNEKRWVNWRLGKVGDRMTKLPYSVNGRKASSTDPKTWSTYKEALEASENMGIVFTPEQNLLGIDIDKCLKRKKIIHEKKDAIEILIESANTYVEISPSRTGLHLYLKLSDPLELIANRKDNFEAYTSGRYFTVTNDPFGEAKEVRTVSSLEALELLKLIGYPWNKEKAQESETAAFVSPVTLDDQTILERMFKSKNGKAIESLYNGDISTHDNDASKADMSLCSHLAFWTGKNSLQMERIWIGSPLGSRKKTQGREDYRRRTIAVAIQGCKEVYETPAMKIEKENPDLDLLFTLSREKEKIYTQNTENMCRILRRHPDFEGRLRYDIFRNALEFLPKDNKWRVIEDNDAVNIQTSIQILFSCFGKVGKDMIYDAMIKVAKENSMDSASDYIVSLKWDGVARLDSWLSSVYGTPSDVYHRAVASNWIKGLVKRIIEPGCKFDYVLVLEGEQGSRKSTSLAILGGSWHVETTMSTDTKDFFMQFQGKALIEFSEGETLSRTEVKRMKAIITMQSDKYRPPYERISQDFPRRCVFAMTTNQDEYLKDETGNRRWLPIKLVFAEANVDWLIANRDQIFAEAYHRVFNLKETIYEFPKEETLAAQEARRIHDQNADLVADWYFNTITDDQRTEGITIHQVYKNSLHGGFAGKAMSKYDEMNIADILKTSLKLESRQTMHNGVRHKRWFLKSSPAEITPKVDLKHGNSIDDDW